MSDGTTKPCTKCGETKPLSEFFRQSSAKDGRRPDCKQCRMKVQSAYFADLVSTEVGRQARRDYGREHMRQWRSNNPERNYANNRRTYEKNREAVLARTAERKVERRGVRRARKAGATIGEVDLDALRAAYSDCYLCSLPLADDIHFDHVIPLSRGGAHCQDNLRPTHPRCNLRKNAKLLSELPWYSGPTDLGVTLA